MLCRRAKYEVSANSGAFCSSQAHEWLKKALLSADRLQQLSEDTDLPESCRNAEYPLVHGPAGAAQSGQVRG